MREEDRDADECTAPMSNNHRSLPDRHARRPTTGTGVPQEVLIARVRAVARWAAPTPAHHEGLPPPPGCDGTTDPPAATDVHLDLG